MTDFLAGLLTGLAITLSLLPLVLLSISLLREVMKPKPRNEFPHIQFPKDDK